MSNNLIAFFKKFFTLVTAFHFVYEYIDMEFHWKNTRKGFKTWHTPRRAWRITGVNKIIYLTRSLAIEECAKLNSGEYKCIGYYIVPKSYKP